MSDKKIAAYSYAGDVTPETAFEMLQKNSEAVLIDVRTEQEWSFVGVPVLPQNKEAIFISWVFYPGMNWNENFIPDFVHNIPNKETQIFFLCKVGGRSFDAAINMTKLGYKNCYNIAGGFEDWKIKNLPWKTNREIKVDE
jgi:rhodanese-related sulfurtransferase